MSASAAKLLQNPRVLLYVAGGIVVLLAGKQLFDALRGLMGAAGKAADQVLDKVADAYVNATHDGVELASDIVFVLPSGARVKPSQVTILSGGRFRYGGTVYLLSGSLGGGAYSAVKVN